MPQEERRRTAVLVGSRSDLGCRLAGELAADGYEVVVAGGDDELASCPGVEAVVGRAAADAPIERLVVALDPLPPAAPVTGAATVALAVRGLAHLLERCAPLLVDGCGVVEVLTPPDGVLDDASTAHLDATVETARAPLAARGITVTTRSVG